MPITISLTPLNVDSSASNFVYAIATLTFSGSYPTGGDTLDFTTVADKLPSTQIIQAFAESQNGNSGYYIPVQGSALNNWKLKCFLGGGTEITAGAYPSSVTSDIVQLSLTARKLLRAASPPQRLNQHRPGRLPPREYVPRHKIHSTIGR